jgi:hypothetical protein
MFRVLPDSISTQKCPDKFLVITVYLLILNTVAFSRATSVGFFRAIQLNFVFFSENEIPTSRHDSQTTTSRPAAHNSSQLALQPSPAYPFGLQLSPLAGSGAGVGYQLAGPASTAFTTFSFFPLEINWKDYERFMTSAYEAIYECKYLFMAYTYIIFH